MCTKLGIRNENENDRKWFTRIQMTIRTIHCHLSYSRWCCSSSLSCIRFGQFLCCLFTFQNYRLHNFLFRIRERWFAYASLFKLKMNLQMKRFAVILAIVIAEFFFTFASMFCSWNTPNGLCGSSIGWGGGGKSILAFLNSSMDCSSILIT